MAASCKLCSFEPLSQWSLLLDCIQWALFYHSLEEKNIIITDLLVHWRAELTFLGQMDWSLYLRELCHSQVSWRLAQQLAVLIGWEAHFVSAVGFLADACHADQPGENSQLQPSSVCSSRKSKDNEQNHSSPQWTYPKMTMVTFMVVLQRRTFLIIESSSIYEWTDIYIILFRYKSSWCFKWDCEKPSVLTQKHRGWD